MKASESKRAHDGLPAVPGVTPALETEEFDEIDAATGARTRVKKYRRGILISETRTSSDPVGMFAVLKEISERSPRRELEQLCARLRQHLKDRGLPSDQQPFWEKIGDEWKEHSGRGERLSAKCDWTTRIKALAEPLSYERAVAELLFRLVVLLKRDGIDAHLWQINSVVTAYSAFRISGPVNRLAHAGVVARAGRKEGPKSRRARSDEVQKVVAAQAEAYWQKFPIYRGNASSTAQAIAESANDILRTKGLLDKTKKGLSIKRLGDYIRNGN